MQANVGIAIAMGLSAPLMMLLLVTLSQIRALKRQYGKG